MKRTIIALAAAAVLGLTACDEYTLPNPPAQSNPEEPVFSSEDLTFADAVTAGAINLPQLQADNSPVHVLDYTLTNFPASYTLRVLADFYSNGDFTGEPITVPCTVTDANTVTIPVAEVQMAFNNLVSKDIVAKPMGVRYSAYAVNGTSEVRLGGSDFYWWQGEYIVTPLPQENVIETAYYLVGNFCNWDITKAIPFTQLNEGSPYDNPDFTVKIDVEKDLADSPDGYQWKVVPMSGYNNDSWDGAFAAVPSNSDTEGNLVLSPEAKAGAGVIRQEGPYMISINMETRKYKVAPAFEYLWVPGMATTTSDDKFDQVLRLATSDYIHYEGTMPLRNRFWFTGQASTKGVSFRPNGDQTDTPNGGAEGKMIYDVSSNAMMKVPAYGLYYVKADVVTLTWSITPIPVISIIGSYNDWNTASALDLTANSKFTEWTVNGVNMPAGEFKFCVNHDWALSYGGAVDNIVQNGGNLNITEAGVYDFTLNFGVSPATLTITKK